MEPSSYPQDQPPTPPTVPPQSPPPRRRFPVWLAVLLGGGGLLVVGCCMVVAVIGVMGQQAASRTDSVFATIEAGLADVRTPEAATQDPLAQPGAPTDIAASQPTATPMVVEAPTAVQSSDVNQQLALLQYVAEVEPHTTAMGEALTTIGELFINGQFGTDEWTTQVTAQFVSIRQSHQSLVELEAVPASMQPIHDSLIDATADCDAMTYVLAEALDNFDLEKIEEATRLMESCGTKLTNTATLIENYQVE